MRFGMVNVGRLVVFDDRGGVWKKVGPEAVKCVFGARDVYEMESKASPDQHVFVLRPSDKSAVPVKQPEGVQAVPEAVEPTTEAQSAAIVLDVSEHETQ